MFLRCLFSSSRRLQRGVGSVGFILRLIVRQINTDDGICVLRTGKRDRSVISDRRGDGDRAGAVLLRLVLAASGPLLVLLCWCLLDHALSRPDPQDSN